MNSAEYRRQLAAQQQAMQWRRFQENLPPGAWPRLTPAEQTQAWLTWSQQDRMASAAQASRGTTTALLWIFIGVPLILVVVVAVMHAAFG